MKPGGAPQTRDPLDLIASLALEKIELNLFRGHGPKDNGDHFFGGHVIAQALLAAYETVEDRVCHSLHAYFIRPGNVHIPVLFEVDRGAGRRQLHHPIASSPSRTASRSSTSPPPFQVARKGLEHQFPMAQGGGAGNTVGRDGAGQAVGRQAFRTAAGAHAPPPARSTCVGCRPAATTMIGRRSLTNRSGCGPRRRSARTSIYSRRCWPMRPTWPSWRRPLRPHGINWQTKGLQSASLDHAMWFHQPFDFNQWILFDQDSPSTSQGRGLVRGEMFTHDGAARGLGGAGVPDAHQAAQGLNRVFQQRGAAVELTRRPGPFPYRRALISRPPIGPTEHSGAFP